MKEDAAMYFPGRPDHSLPCAVHYSFSHANAVRAFIADDLLREAKAPGFPEGRNGMQRWHAGRGRAPCLPNTGGDVLENTTRAFRLLPRDDWDREACMA